MRVEGWKERQEGGEFEGGGGVNKEQGEEQDTTKSGLGPQQLTAKGGHPASQGLSFRLLLMHQHKMTEQVNAGDLRIAGSYQAAPGLCIYHSTRTPAHLLHTCIKCQWK